MNVIKRLQRDEPEEHATSVLVIGSDRFGLAVADCLTRGAQAVTFVSNGAQPSDDSGVELHQRNISDASQVRSLAAEFPDTDMVIVVDEPGRALLTGYLARREFDSCLVVAGVEDPRTRAAFQDTGVDTISLPRLLADGIRDRYW